MTQNNSYPSPDAPPSDGMHPPFYTSQHQMPPTEHSQIPRHAAAAMHGGNNDMRSFSQATQVGQGMRQAQPSTPQQLAQRGLDVDQSQDQNNPDSSSRKRSKVSRACDECRRKKIRCDAESETPGIQCSACRRSGGVCEFSRAPQKRGPSKGYIKELAERVNLLEYRQGATPPELQYAPVVQEPASGSFPLLDPTPRKRSHDLVDHPQSYSYGQPSLPGFTNRNQRTHHDTPVTDNQGRRVLHPTTNIQTPQTASRNVPSLIYMYGDIVDKYYDLIHPTLPLLMHSRDYLQPDLENIPSIIREAYYATLDAAVSSVTHGDNDSVFKKATDLLVLLQIEESSTRTDSANLAYLQALILMVVAIQNSGPRRAHNTIWLGQAIGIATSIKLHQSSSFDFSQNDPDSFEKTGRRAWLILIVLDRWQAVATSVPLRIPEENAQVLPSDRDIVGDPAYRLCRASLILNHFSAAFLYTKQAPKDWALMLNSTLNGEISFCFEGVADLVEHTRTEGPAIATAQPRRLKFDVKLVPAHLRLLANLHLALYASKTDQLLDSAHDLVALLLSQKSPPILTHHFAALAAFTLSENMDKKKSVDGLIDLRNGLENGNQIRFNYARMDDRPAWDAAIIAFINKKLTARSNAGGRGLAQLADAAVGKSTNGEGDDGVGAASGDSHDWTEAASKGYLDLFEA